MSNHALNRTNTNARHNLRGPDLKPRGGKAPQLRYFLAVYGAPAVVAVVLNGSI